MVVTFLYGLVVFVVALPVLFVLGHIGHLVVDGHAPSRSAPPRVIAGVIVAFVLLPVLAAIYGVGCVVESALYPPPPPPGTVESVVKP